MEFEDDGLFVGCERLEPHIRWEIRKRSVGGDEEGDASAALVGLELLDDAGGGEHGGGDVEIVAVDEGLGDVEAKRGAGLGGHEVEAVRDQEGVDGEDGDVVGEVGDEGQNGGV